MQIRALSCAIGLSALVSVPLWAADLLENCCDNGGSPPRPSVRQNYSFRELRSPNTLGIYPGDFLHFGTYIRPNLITGDDGPGPERTTVTLTPVEPIICPLPSPPFGVNATCPPVLPLPFVDSPAAPDNFDSVIPFHESLTGPWIVTATNPYSSNSPLSPVSCADLGSLVPCIFIPPVRRPDLSIPASLGFMRDMNLSGSGTDVTFTFSPPTNTALSNVGVRIWNLDQLNSNGKPTLLYVNNGLPGDTTTHTPPLYLNSNLDTLHLGTHYAVAILAEVKDQYGPASRSRTFFQFTTLDANSPPTVYLPIVGADGVYTFIITTEPAKTYFIDPDPAIGYDYAIGPGGQNFASVVLPKAGDNRFDLYLFDGTKWVFQAVLASGVPYFFGGSGVPRFRVSRIEPSAGIDPTNATAFISGLTFVAAGPFTGSMTALTADANMFDIDIKPDDKLNAINPSSKGDIPVAIISRTGFDATSDINIASLRFGRAGSENSLKSCSKRGEDVNGDLRKDLLCHFTTQVAGFLAGDSIGVLTGFLNDGSPFEGADTVRIVPKGH